MSDLLTLQREFAKVEDRADVRKLILEGAAGAWADEVKSSARSPKLKAINWDFERHYKISGERNTPTLDIELWRINWAISQESDRRVFTWVSIDWTRHEIKLRYRPEMYSIYKTLKFTDIL